MISISRHQRQALIALVAVLCAAGGALFIGRGSAAATSVSAAPAARQAATSSVLVVRRAAGHDSLWLLPPAGGVATAAGALPGLAGSVAVAPDGRNVAYLPQSGAPRVWVGYGPSAPRTISLAPAGVKKVDSFTWLTNDKLLVSGVTSGRYADPRKDRLFLVTVSTGKARSFRDLRGTEPSVAPAIGRVAYVRLTTLDPGSTANGNSPLVRESLKLLRLDRSGGGRVVVSERYRVYAGRRELSQPKLSPDAVWALTGETGSDVRVTYDLRDIQGGQPFLSVFAPALQAAAGWDPTGQRTAFAGTEILRQDQACVWVYDTDTGMLMRSPTGLLPDFMISDLAWSPDGDLVAGAWDSTGATSTRHVLVLPGDLASVRDLGTGRLPVWVKP